METNEAKCNRIDVGSGVDRFAKRQRVCGQTGDTVSNDRANRSLLVYGWGDGGGGPTKMMLEAAARLKDFEGLPKVTLEKVSSFLPKAEADARDPEVWVGELYLELHRGTLTSIAGIKRGNRFCENRLKDAEFVSVLAALLKGSAYPREALLSSWKQLLLNQFHDILPGSSIAEVNDEALASFAECLADASRLRDEALSTLAVTGTGEAALIANNLSWDRTGEMEIVGLGEGTWLSGKDVVSQTYIDIEGGHHLIVKGLTLPASGYVVVPTISGGGSEDQFAKSPFMIDGDFVETPFARVTLGKSGSIGSFYDKLARRELVARGGAFNTLLLGEDVPATWDNWDIDRDQAVKLVPQDGLISREVVAEGPLQLRIRQIYHIGRASQLTQDIVFHADSAEVGFETVVDWQEKYQFLKTEFATKSNMDMSLGTRMTTHRSTVLNSTFAHTSGPICRRGSTEWLS